MTTLSEPCGSAVVGAPVLISIGVCGSDGASDDVVGGTAGATGATVVVRSSVSVRVVSVVVAAGAGAAPVDGTDEAAPSSTVVVVVVVAVFEIAGGDVDVDVDGGDVTGVAASTSPGAAPSAGGTVGGMAGATPLAPGESSLFIAGARGSSARAAVDAHAPETAIPSAATSTFLPVALMSLLPISRPRARSGPASHGLGTSTPPALSSSRRLSPTPFGNEAPSDKRRCTLQTGVHSERLLQHRACRAYPYRH